MTTTILSNVEEFQGIIVLSKSKLEDFLTEKT